MATSECPFHKGYYVNTRQLTKGTTMSVACGCTVEKNHHGGVIWSARDIKGFTPVVQVKHNKYSKAVKDTQGNEIGFIDVYSVLSAFNVTEPGLQHAIKKLLMPGQRGKGDILSDLKEAVQSVERTIVTIKEKN